MNKKFLLILCLLLLTALIAGASLYTHLTEQPIENAGVAVNAAVETVSLTYQGTAYPIKKHIQTVLLIGTDSVDAYQEEDALLDYYNFSQADVLMLLVLDTDTNTAQVIQLNRDTMTEVPWLDVLGNDGGTEFKQLCLAYNYGDGGTVSCKNTVKAVSMLLFDVPIQSFLQLPMSAIGVLNDLVGGVPVTIEEDLTVIDPAFTKGASVWLQGAQAEKFLRVRMSLEDDTNLSRMRRHRTYLDSFQLRAKAALDSDSEFAMKLLEKLADYLQSDLTAQQLSDLVEKLDTATIAPIGYPEGDLIFGDGHYEFYMNEDSAWELVRSAYCE